MCSPTLCLHSKRLSIHLCSSTNPTIWRCKHSHNTWLLSIPMYMIHTFMERTNERRHISFDECSSGIHHNKQHWLGRKDEEKGKTLLIPYIPYINGSSNHNSSCWKNILVALQVPHHAVNNYCDRASFLPLMFLPTRYSSISLVNIKSNKKKKICQKVF